MTSAPAPADLAAGGRRPVWLGSASLYGALFIFFLVNAVCATDRVVLSVLIPPIKNELALTDAQVGLLGFAGAIFYALFGVVSGRLTDTSNRPRLLALSVGLFGLATAACGATASYVQLFIARIGVGIGDAGCVPSKYSMIGDLYPPAQRASVLALVYAGVGIGATASVVLAGILGERLGWRATFAWMGVPGIVLMLVVWAFIRDPGRGTFEVSGVGPAVTPSLGDALRRLARNRTFLAVMLAYSLTTFGIYGIGHWLPSFLVRSFGLSLAQVGVAYGAVNGIGFLGGLLVGAFMSARLLRSDRRWELWLPGLVNLAVLAANVVVFTATTLNVSLAFMGLSAMLLGLTVGPASAAIQSTVPSRMRGIAVAVAMFVSAFVGQGLGPWLIGVGSDALAPGFGKESLRLTMLAATSMYVVGAVVYGLGGRSYHRDRVD